MCSKIALLQNSKDFENTEKIHAVIISLWKIFQNILYTKSTDFALIQSSLYNFSQIIGVADPKAKYI